MITPTEVRKRLKEIREAAFDDEKAHGLEDQLYLDVLEAVAAGSSDARQLARLALNARRIKFYRWLA